MLSDAQIDRYSRQIILPEVGARGQERLLSATLAVVDGSDDQSLLPLYLAAAGVGRLKLWQPGVAGTSAAIDDLFDLNPDCKVEICTQPLGKASAPAFVGDGGFGAVIVLQSAADVATQMNVECVRSGAPLIWGQAAGTVGHLAVFDSRSGHGCLACAGFPQESHPPSGTLDRLTVATLASLQAVEAIKLVLDGASPLAGKLLRIDVAAATVTTPPLATHPDCAVCRQGLRQ